MSSHIRVISGMFIHHLMYNDTVACSHKHKQCCLIQGIALVCKSQNDVLKKHCVCLLVSLGKKATIHQLTTMLTTSKNVLFQAIIKLSSHQYRWLAGSYDLEIGHFKKGLACWLPGG